MYSAGEISDVATENGVYVDQETSGEYAIHEFKDFITSNGGVVFEWRGKSSTAPSVSVVKLQIYNYDSDAWEDVDSDNTTAADTNFSLQGDIADATNYRLGDVVTCRVWQLGV
jgi:carbohydrate-selective porin OprB